jgi:transmembrane sensor
MTEARFHRTSQTAAEWCTRITAGELTPEDVIDLKAWLAKSDANMSSLKDALAIWESLDVEPLPSQFELMRDVALSDMRRVEARRKAFSLIMPGRRTAIAAGVAAVLVLGAVAVPIFSALHDDVYETGAQERRIVALDDGSKLTLDADTEVKVHFGKDTRKLWLVRGRATFAVAKNPLRPFVVGVEDRTIVATGTEFSVEKLTSQLRVVLYDGHVSILSKHLPAAGKFPAVAKDLGSNIEANLEPQQAFVLSNATQRAQVVPISGNDNQAWENGFLDFENELLPVAVERVNRYSDLKVSLIGLENKRILVNGMFKAGDTGAFVDGISSVNRLKKRRTEEGYALYQ